MDDKYTKSYYLHIRLDELLEAKDISRAKLCKDLDLQRTNLNRYYRNQVQRLDVDLIVSLCKYLQCDISDLLEIREKENPSNSN